MYTEPLSQNMTTIHYYNDLTPASYGCTLWDSLVKSISLPIN